MTNNHPAHFAPCAPTHVDDVTLHTPDTPTLTIHVREPGGLSPEAKAALESRLRQEMLSRAAQNN
jgi:hypothetical protein